MRKLLAGLDQALFWVPWKTRPNIISYALALLRCAALTFMAMLPVLAFTRLDLGRFPGLFVEWLIMATFEEFARFSIIKEAEEPYRAAIYFATALALLELGGYSNAHALSLGIATFLLVRLPSVLGHYLFSLGMAAGVKHRPSLVPAVMTTLILLHAALDAIAWKSSI